VNNSVNNLAEEVQGFKSLPLRSDSYDLK